VAHRIGAGAAPGRQAVRHDGVAWAQTGVAPLSGAVAGVLGGTSRRAGD